ncbi:MAG: hypothetical protein RR318_05035 [Alistipes sp.]
MPVTLFENNEAGNLTFDLTYKQNSKTVTLNFTYFTKQPFPADSVQFVHDATTLSGVVWKLYIEPDRKVWKHRYTLSEKFEKFAPFFSNDGTAEAIVYSAGSVCHYKMKQSAWSSYAPVGFKIFEMIEINEKSNKQQDKHTLENSPVTIK